MLVFSGERRFIALDAANDPGVVAGATLTGTPTVTFVAKRGEVAVAGVVEATPIAPAIVGSQVRSWCAFAAVAPGRYWLQATVTLSNGETALLRAAVVVE